MLTTYGFMQDINYCDIYDLFFKKEPKETCHEQVEQHCRFQVGPNGPNLELLHFFFFRITGTEFQGINDIKSFMKYEH